MEAQPTQKTILVVDDNAVILKAIAMSLSPKGYRVLTADSGAETITILRNNRPDLILLDLDFPPDAANIGSALSDGFLIIDWARRMCDAEKIPVFIISSSDPEKYRNKAEAAHILTFFQKPLDTNALLTAIKKTVG
ncbi:MAG TPA: response regulator [Verrucomicrobiae bacterium]|nr:response regulator [Verrucomicrobiae bacterium]